MPAKPKAKPVAKPVAPKPVAKPKPKTKQPKYVAVHATMYNPIAKVYIPTGTPGVMLEKDSWVDIQLDRGLIKEI